MAPVDFSNEIPMGASSATRSHVPYSSGCTPTSVALNEIHTEVPGAIPSSLLAPSVTSTVRGTGPVVRTRDRAPRRSTRSIVVSQAFRALPSGRLAWMDMAWGWMVTRTGPGIGSSPALMMRPSP